MASSDAARVVAGLRSALAAALDLALPADCAGCQVEPGLLCARCASALDGPARAAWPTPAPVGLPPPWAVAAYDGVARSLILAHKEHGRRALAAPLGRALARSVLAAIEASPSRPDRATLLVPMPSRRAAVRARGHDPTLSMARHAARALRRAGRDVVVRPVLRMAASVADQAGLDAASRAANLRDAVLLPQRLSGLLRSGAAVSQAVLLVDDVITTGSSLAAAAETLHRAGVTVRGAALVAATARRTPFSPGPDLFEVTCGD